MKTQFSTKIEAIRSDNGLEFDMLVFHATKGVIHQKSCVEIPQQNGTIERKHQHLLNVARSLMIQSQLPIQYWSYSILHFVHLINRLPNPIIANKTPYELLYSCSPTYDDLRVFGALCFASTLTANRSKFDLQARKCVILGFQPGVKGYLSLDIQSQSIFLSRHVIFYESTFPFHNI